MREKSNQTTIARLTHPLECIYEGIKAWSVQGSNLRPPVNVGPFPASKEQTSPHLIVAKPRHESRTAGESAASNGNQTAIRVPSPYNPPFRAFLVWGWAA